MEIVSCDILIIGCGIAGQAVSAPLLGTNRKITFIESGPSHETRAKFRRARQSLKIAQGGDRHFGVGGTSHIWGGNLVPFTNLELSDPLWPIDYVELQDFLEPALSFHGFADMANEVAEHWKECFLNVKREDVGIQNFFRLRRSDRSIMPIAAKHNKNVNIIEDLWCEKIISTDSQLRVQCLNLKGETQWFTFNSLVIATGGLETLRILNNSAILETAGFPLGAAWSPHMTGIVGYLESRDEILLGHLELDNIIRTSYLHIPSALKNNRSAWKITLLSLRTSLLELPRTGLYSLEILMRFVWAKIRGMNLFMINADGDQEPNFESCVSFLDGKTMQIHHALCDLDLRSINSMQVKVQKFFENVGRVRMFRHPEKKFFGRSHHLGGARAAKSSRDGIVDSNLALHGHQNVFLCSSAVFPTFSSANPTLLLTQLALRLCNYLKNRII